MASKPAKKVGRPRVDATPIMVKMPPAEVAALDGWIELQGDPALTRPAALRRLATLGLAWGERQSRPRVKRTARS
jgi:hypothetical protein